jgi:hypothetical protein
MHGEGILIIIAVIFYVDYPAFFSFILHLGFNGNNYLIYSQSDIIGFNHLNVFVNSINQQKFFFNYRKFHFQF